MVARRWQLVEERDRLTRKQVLELFMRQDGLCPLIAGGCGQKLETKGHRPIEFIDEHVAPLWRGGSNELKNRALFCKVCAGDKTKAEATQRAKAYAVRDKHIGIEKKPKPEKRFKKKMDGTVIEIRTGKVVSKGRR